MSHYLFFFDNLITDTNEKRADSSAVVYILPDWDQNLKMVNPKFLNLLILKHIKSHPVKLQLTK